MKKLFFALALTGFLGASAINTVSAMTHAKVCVNGGEEDKKKKTKKDCKKDAKCCSKDVANATTADKQACAEKKVCSKATKCCNAGTKTATTTSETKTDVKKVEEVR